MSGQLSPVVLFAYNRPEHTRRCLEALGACPEAATISVTAFVDGPRDAAGLGLQRQVIAVIEDARSAFGHVEITAHSENQGLAANIISGVSQMLAAHDSVIVLEDDLLVEPRFLTYMNRALERYTDDERVGSIHAYCYPGMPGPDAFFFMRGADCWGWATWSSRWRLFEADGEQLLRKLLQRRLLQDFTLGHTAPYGRMLCQQIVGRNASWAIRWHASLFLADRLTLYPRQSLVQNIGLDGSGTHCAASSAYDSPSTPGDELPAGPEWPHPAPSAIGSRHFRYFFSGQRSGLARLLYVTVSWLNDSFWVLRALRGS